MKFFELSLLLNVCLPHYKPSVRPSVFKLIAFCFYFATFSCAVITANASPNSGRRTSLRRNRFSCSGEFQSQFVSSPRTGDNGFRIKIEGDPESYIPLHEYTVTLQSTMPSSFRGFAIRSVSTIDERNAGSFSSINSFTSRVMTSCNNVITHSNPGKKTRVQTRWVAPSNGCVRISASVVQKGTIWFKDDGMLSLVLCQQNTTRTTSGSPSCCACGSALYNMRFYGLWSPTSHPKDYPAFSTHWSNIVGASHSSNYVIWEYGGYASEGIQKVAEWGWPGTLEDEIRAQTAEDVKSIIKTKAQWPAYQPRNLREPPSDEFSVDANRHLVSLVTMLGPSPDWNVGLSRESMCTETCGWMGTRTYNLIPWDAGTDSGLSYMSPNSPTIPHEKIRNLTSSDHLESPFFDPEGGPIPPVARIVIRRMNVMGEQCGESETIVDDDVEVTSFSDQARSNPACMYTEWSHWSECGVTCGWGLKTRSRQVKFAVNPAACETTMEKEICQGSGHCEGGTNITACLFSEWTSWTSCSASCGSSLRFRSRVLKWPSEPENCHDPLKEMSDCGLPPCSCAYSPWSEWMNCPVTCGVGQTLRKRALLTPQMSCSGSLMQINRCLTSLSCSADIVTTRGCSYSPWSDWSACPVTCGVGQTFRKRALQSASATSCRDFYMETSKCMTSESCDVRCEYGDWSEWMTCSVTCGVGTTLRKRFLSDTNLASSCDGVVMETAPCHNRPCGDLLNHDCSFSPWTPWMPCSVSCGKGETLRKRFLNHTESTENCQDFEMETNLCMVACDVTLTSPECAYSDWSPWMPCSQSCETFRKKLLQSSPSSVNCDAVVMETKTCNGESCPTDSPSLSICATSPWQPWSECSVTCGRRGHMTRHRTVIDQSAVDERCKAPLLTERRKCHSSVRCARNCVTTLWSEWTSCGDTCEHEHKIQTRHRLVMSPTKKRRHSRCRRQRQRRRCHCNA